MVLWSLGPKALRYDSSKPQGKALGVWAQGSGIWGLNGWGSGEVEVFPYISPYASRDLIIGSLRSLLYIYIYIYIYLYIYI